MMSVSHTYSPIHKCNYHKILHRYPKTVHVEKGTKLIIRLVFSTNAERIGFQPPYLPKVRHSWECASASAWRSASVDVIHRLHMPSEKKNVANHYCKPWYQHWTPGIPTTIPSRRVYEYFTAEPLALPQQGHSYCGTFTRRLNCIVW